MHVVYMYSRHSTLHNGVGSIKVFLHRGRILDWRLRVLPLVPLIDTSWASQRCVSRALCNKDTILHLFIY